MYSPAVEFTDRHKDVPEASCLEVYVRDRNDGMWEDAKWDISMIATCLDGSTCPYVLIYTELDRERGGPVHDLNTGFIYVNYACAQCNGLPNVRQLPIYVSFNLEIDPASKREVE